jgi:LPXTG-motif cell wall-anchored protein
LQHLILGYGYWAILLLMVAESACVPIPCEVIMLVAGAVAGGAIAGAHLSLVGITCVGVAGNLLGSLLAWAGGFVGGRQACRRWGRFVRLEEHHLEIAERWFHRYGARAVLLGRFLPIVRTFVSLPAGFARMNGLRFASYTLLGCVPSIFALAWTGQVAGRNWKTVATEFHNGTYAMLAVGAALIASCLLVSRRRRRNRLDNVLPLTTGGTDARPNQIAASSTLLEPQTRGNHVYQ